ncbi:DUF2577 domain-containing protein [Paenibacillus larvae]|uniref:Phage protein n=4 Tax=Paenibacillus larvae TaxID=1464 RepID=A0A1V0UVJ3_9BACL|nr:DUF2577 domain-containing protein [Paenibacillus larvae]AQR78072.1 hypothetical protein BXP28_12815 [Paenibacillus larvae subsp. larvae]ARF69214.1 hypothetical protein B7C51_17415 [Paenibacillus larvae subsp. pulvifaciens]AVF20752.1 hypothetical protein ERICI_00839 [Paenibacillus larvae subsp. larvae]ETK28283.1 hypothetical protein ERIC1_1c17450 [Paenibacillus larvae subsp. larvae DSM 25719]MCY7475899.1 DUF2577 domain-containing protein [Paenibacillus larvae]
MLNIIKQAALGAVDTSNPVSILFGEVTKANPLEVSVDQRFSLSEDFLIVPEHVTGYQPTVEGQTIPVRQGLRKGDRVILLRAQGGHSFVILGKAV